MFTAPNLPDVTCNTMLSERIGSCGYSRNRKKCLYDEATESANVSKGATAAKKQYAAATPTLPKWTPAPLAANMFPRVLLTLLAVSPAMHKGGTVSRHTQCLLDALAVDKTFVRPKCKFVPRQPCVMISRRVDVTFISDSFENKWHTCSPNQGGIRSLSPFGLSPMSAICRILKTPDRV